MLSAESREAASASAVSEAKQLSSGAIEHRKPLRRYAVIAWEGGYWIALKGFAFRWRAVRYARYLERWAISSQALVVDSRAESGPIYRDECLNSSW